MNSGWPVKAGDWKRRKRWVVRKKIKPAIAASRAFEKEVAAVFCDLAPLYRFTSLPSWKK